ncbi:MAG: AAA family ATPase [Christensenella sp.]|uniref:AAA family ATPase n=1 Tax=Christensenella sp. TaxID=1935934 RepID=UPI002B1EBB20|nr:AAA family ATPase [Christensenella sp.]MEA5003851.1 AAA family ATPase [Christensenella sp.]
MSLKKICLENFTVFEKIEIEFCDGINVFLGDNGTGKTHIMKLLYAACQAAQMKKTAIDFQTKVIKVFRPDESSLLRLVRRGVGASNASVKVSSDKSNLSLLFHSKHKKKIVTTGMDKWEKEFSLLTSTFIPAKEILSHSRNLVQAINAGNVDFDDTYKDIIVAASVDISRGPDNERKKKYLKRLQAITQGRVRIENEEFYLLPTGQSQSKLEFQLVAEGLRKTALLWQLIKNGTLENGSVLFWDEPEANINPQNIPAIVDLLLDLQEDGVQIFIATHDYFLAKYLDARKTKTNTVVYHALYKLNGTGTIQHECGEDFALLKNNSILEQSIDLYKEEVKKVME